MSWSAHHIRSEAYASQAEEFHKQRDANRAAELYVLAARAEVDAIADLDRSETRILGITVLSATSLYCKAQKFDLAKRLAHQWLATELLPPFAADRLEELLQVIRYEESRLRAGIRFFEGEVLVAIGGGEILYGAAPLELILRKVEQIGKIFHRTTELLLELPLTARSGTAKEVKHQCALWLLQAPPGSYQFAVRVRKPEEFEQLSFMPDLELRVEKIVQKFLEIVEAIVRDPKRGLLEIVPQEAYREEFLKLVRDLAPPLSGKSFDRIEIASSGSVESYPIVIRAETRKAIAKVLKNRKQVQIETHRFSPPRPLELELNLNLEEA